MLALFDVDAVGEEYAPGALAYNPSRDENDCPGCLAHPLHECAACGAPASIALPAGAHAMSLCGRCYSLVLDIRASAQEHRERMALNTAAMIAGRQKLRERQQQRQKQRPATSPVAPARAKVSPDLAPAMPSPAHPAQSTQPIQAPLFDLDAMPRKPTRQEQRQEALQTRLQERQQARARERQERQEQRERERREREEQRQTRAQARQQGRKRAKGRNVPTRGAGALTAPRTRQERQEEARASVSDSLARSHAPGAPGGAQPHSRPRNTFNAYRGRPDRREEREELASMASMARRSGEEGAA